MSAGGRHFALYGTKQIEPQPLRLTAGRLSLDFLNGSVRNICYDGIEVLRAISYLVRDKDWGTYDPRLSNLNISELDGDFDIHFDARCDGPNGSALHFKARISGSHGGQLIFDVIAQPDTDFETNRCGFCILHPINELAGSNVTVEHVDGSIRATALPDMIEPWQPFKRMRAISHEVMVGVIATCRMDGDVFEMEDQRNWSDASYKTYVRPLELPWPYVMPAGEANRQTIRLNIADSRAHSQSSQGIGVEKAIELSIGQPAGAMPALALVITPEETATTHAQRTQIIQSGVQHLLLLFDPLAGHGVEALQGFAQLAKQTKLPVTLELALPCRDDPAVELRDIAAMVRASGLALSALIVSPSVDRQSTPPGSKWPECPPLDLIYASARAAFPGISLGGGMLSYFTELNRKRVPPEQLDFITHCTCPIVHAADDVSVMQSLEALSFITRSVRALYGDMPYHIGPSTIAMRQNPYGGATKDNPDSLRIPMANRDPRHNALFGAAWAVGYAARTTEANLSLLTLSALTGPFGLIAGEGEPVAAGGMRPLYHVVKALSEMAGWQRLESQCSHPEKLAFVMARSPSSAKRAMIANLTPNAQIVNVAAFGEGMHVSILDERSISGPISATPSDLGTIALGGFAVAFLRQPALD